MDRRQSRRPSASVGKRLFPACSPAGEGILPATTLNSRAQFLSAWLIALNLLRSRKNRDWEHYFAFLRTLQEKQSKENIVNEATLDENSASLPKTLLLGSQGLRAGWRFILSATLLLLTGMRAFGAFYFGSLALRGTQVLKYGLWWGLAFFLVGIFEESFSRGYAQATLAQGI